MKTKRLLNLALDGVAEVSSTLDDNPNALLASVGINSSNAFREWMNEQAEELIQIGVIRNLVVNGIPGVDLIDSMNVAMMQGILVGYQMALIRRSEEDGE